MARSNFVERQFRCTICGDSFKALSGNRPVIDPVCMNCGLLHSPEKRQRLIQEQKQRGKRK